MSRHLFVCVLVFLFVFSFVPFVGSDGTYEDYLEGVEPVWSVDFDDGTYGDASHVGSTHSLISDGVGGYYSRWNSTSYCYLQAPSLPLRNYSISMDFAFEYPNSYLGISQYYTVIYPSVTTDNYGFGWLWLNFWNEEYFNDGLEFYGEDLYVGWHHITVTKSQLDLGGLNGKFRQLVYMDGVLISDVQTEVTDHVQNSYQDVFEFGLCNPHGTHSNGADVYIDNVEIWDEAPMPDGSIPTPTPTPSPSPTASPTSTVTPVPNEIPTVYLLFLLVGAVIAIVLGLFKTFELSENPTVGLLLALIGFIVLVVIILWVVTYVGV